MVRNPHWVSIEFKSIPTDGDRAQIGLLERHAACVEARKAKAATLWTRPRGDRRLAQRLRDCCALVSIVAIGRLEHRDAHRRRVRYRRKLALLGGRLQARGQDLPMPRGVVDLAREID